MQRCANPRFAWRHAYPFEKAGVYFVRISTAREVTTGRVVLVR